MSCQSIDTGAVPTPVEWVTFGVPRLAQFPFSYTWICAAVLASSRRAEQLTVIGPDTRVFAVVGLGDGRETHRQVMSCVAVVLAADAGEAGSRSDALLSETPTRKSAQYLLKVIALPRHYH